MPSKVTPEFLANRAARQRQIRADKKAGTHVPRVHAPWKDKPDMSLLTPRGDAPVQLPEGSPELLPVVKAAIAGRTPCSTMDPRLFDSDASKADQAIARAACASCDTRESCISAARDMDASAMIWGGINFGSPAELRAAELEAS